MPNKDPRDLDQKVQSLKRVPAFANLSPESIRPIALKLDVRKVMREDDILRKGDPIQELYCIYQGEVAIFTDKEVTTVLYAGDSFGDEILQDKVYEARATFRAKETTTYYALGRSAFRELKSEYPQLSNQVTIYPRYGWQEPGERVVFVSRQRISLFRIFRFLILVVVVATLIIAYLVWFLSRRFLLSMEVLLVIWSVITYLFYKKVSYQNTWFVLTNTRIIEHRVHSGTTSDEPYVQIPLKHIESLGFLGDSVHINLRPPGNVITLSNLASAERFADAAKEAMDHIRLLQESAREQLIEDLLMGKSPQEEVTSGIIQWKPHWLPFAFELAPHIIILLISVAVFAFLIDSFAINVAFFSWVGISILLLGQWKILIWRGRRYSLSPNRVSRQDSKWDFLRFDLSTDEIKLDEISSVSLERGFSLRRSALGKMLQFLEEKSKVLQSFEKRFGYSLRAKFGESLDIGTIVVSKTSSHYEYTWATRLVFAHVSNPRKVYFDIIGAIYERMEMHWLERSFPLVRATGRVMRRMLETGYAGAGESPLASQVKLPASDSLRVMVVIPYPVTEEGQLLRDLHVEAEWYKIRDALQQNNVSVLIRRLRPPTLNSLRDALTEAKNLSQPYDVVHIIGHGSPEAIHFENEFGELDKISGEDLACTLSGSDTKLVVLNLCNSLQIADRIIELDAACSVLCSKDLIADEVGVLLAQNLYKLLSQGKSVREAVEQTKRKIGERPDMIVENLVLKIHPNAKDSLHLTIPVQMENLKIVDGLPKIYNLSADKYTSSREPVLADIAKEMDRPDCQAVHLYGDAQRKATSLACEAGARLCHKFQGGVVYVDCAQMANLSNVVKEIRAGFDQRVQIPWASTIDAENLISLTEDLRNYSLNQGPILLILDKLDRISGDDKQQEEFERFLAGLDPNRGNRVIVTTRHDVQEWSPNQGVFKFPIKG